MNYKFIIAAITVLAFTACSEGRKTPDGYEMDNPPPSAYAPSDYDTFDQNEYEAPAADEDIADEVEIEAVEEDVADEVGDVVAEAEDDGVEETDEDDAVDEEEE